MHVFVTLSAMVLFFWVLLWDFTASRTRRMSDSMPGSCVWGQRPMLLLNITILTYALLCHWLEGKIMLKFVKFTVWKLVRTWFSTRYHPPSVFFFLANLRRDPIETCSGKLLRCLQKLHFNASWEFSRYECRCPVSPRNIMCSPNLMRNEKTIPEFIAIKLVPIKIRRLIKKIIFACAVFMFIRAGFSVFGAGDPFKVRPFLKDPLEIITV